MKNVSASKGRMFRGEGQSVGELLRETRELKAISQKQAASSLNLMASHIRALESDAYNPRLEGRHFDGFLSAYSRLLGLNPEVITAMYQNQFDRAAHREQGSQGLMLRGATVALLLGVAVTMSQTGVPVQLWLTSASERVQSVFAVNPAVQEPSTSALPQLPLADEPATEWVEQRPSEVAAAAPVVAESSIDIAAKQVSSKAPVARKTASESRSTARRVPQDPFQLAELQLDFDENCWVEVYDANGDEIFLGVKRGGEQLLLVGTAPFDVILGNAKSVSVKLDGADIPVYLHKYSDHTRMVMSPRGGVTVKTSAEPEHDKQKQQWVAERLPEPEKIEAAAPALLAVNKSDTLASQAALRPAVLSSAPEASPAEPLEDILAFTFAEDCWVEIYDRWQDPLLMEMKYAGESLRIIGEAPFEVRVGNSSAVSLTLNGSPVLIERHPEIRSTELIVGRTKNPS